MRSIYSLVISGFLLLLVGVTQSEAAIPAAASSDFRYSLGYLVCDFYGTNLSNGVTDATDELNACIEDAWNNQLAAYLSNCTGTYLISSTLVNYEWLTWNPATNTARSAPHNNHVFRGARGCGTSRPTIKIAPGSTSFNSATAIRPMVVYRSFWPTNANANPATKPHPSHPLSCGGCPPNSGDPDDPVNYRESGGINFGSVFDNINLDTSGKVGAIGITMQTGQSCSITNVKVTATGSYAGIYSPPGRNSPTVNIEVIGGKYGIIASPMAGTSLELPAGQGLALVGLTLTNQDTRALYLADGTTVMVVGFEITKSSDGPAIDIPSNAAIIDGKITMSGAAADDVAILNSNSGGQGLNNYTRNVFVNGTSQLIKSGPEVTSKSGTASWWAQIAEYGYTDKFQLDGSTSPSVFPSFTVGSARFEARTIINGTLSGGSGGIALTSIFSTASTAPPADIRTRHVWTGNLPGFEDGAYTDPRNYRGCVAYPGYDPRQVVTQPIDCSDALQDAINAAATAGHNRVILPRGALLLTKTVNLGAHTKLMGAGAWKSMLAYMDDWVPTTASPFLQTANDATGTTYAGFFTMYVRTQPTANDFMYYLRWRAGRASMTVGLQLEYQFGETCPTPNMNQARKAIWFSNNGGGRHYGNMPDTGKSLDRNPNMRLFFVDATTQPLALYGANMEMGKAPCGSSTANTEIANTSAGVRIYGIKREGEASTVLITNSSNVGVFGMGAMSGPPYPTAEAYLKVTGSSNNIVLAPSIVRNASHTGNSMTMVKETISPAPGGAAAGSKIPWPHGVSIYKRGQLDDAPFGTTGTPSPTAPSFLSAEILAANRLDACWEISDATAMIPPSGTSGWTVLVQPVGGGTPVSQPVTSSTLQGLNCYHLNFAGGTITSGTQSVVLSYSPGNITAGGPGTPAATAFSGFTVTNNLNPVLAPSYTQVAYGFRSLHGGTDAASSPWYTSAAGVFESIPFRAVAGGAFRTRIKVGVTTANAPPQAFQVYYNENEGTYIPLTNSCATEGLCFADMPELADGLALPEQLLTPVQATFVPCGVMESATGQVLVTLPTGSETECEIGAQTKSTVTLGNRYRLQLRRAGGGAFDVYPEAGIPLVTIVNPRASFAVGSNQ